MANSLVLKLKSVGHGKSQNWLVFKGFIPQHDINRLYTFEFCGTDLMTSAYLTGDQETQLRETLIERFGYPPYNNLEEIEDKLTEERYYRIELTY